MGRWEADASGRLRAAAMELYVEQGYEETTVAEIATRAGLTARTFFRHFADKREVLFAGADQLQALMVAALEAAPAAATPMQAVAAALDAAGEMLGQHREHSRRRQAVINSHAELQARELIKMAALAGAMAGALRRRGVPEPDASLAAESGTVVLRVAFERWIAPAEPAANEAGQAVPAERAAPAEPAENEKGEAVPAERAEPAANEAGEAVPAERAAPAEPADGGAGVAVPVVGQAGMAAPMAADAASRTTPVDAVVPVEATEKAEPSLVEMMRESLDRLTTVTTGRR